MKPLEAECLEQLEEYVKRFGGHLGPGWTCRAQVRDCGTRAGSVDTWFTSPTGQVYRSKIAAARGLGLDPSRKNPSQKPSKTKSSDDPNNPKACGKSGGSKNKNKKSPKTNVKGAFDDALKGQANLGAPRFTDLTLEEMGELLLSMANAVDLNDCYDGLLFYKEEQLRYEARMAQRFRYKELLAKQLSMEQLPNQGLESPDDGKHLDVMNVQEGFLASELHEACAGSDESKSPMSHQDRLIDDCSLEVKHPKIEDAENEEAYQREEETNMIMLGNGIFVRRSSRNASSSKPKTLNEEKNDANTGLEPGAHTVEAMAAMVDEVEELQPPGPPCFDGWETEVELIRKCLVRVPSRLGRPASKDPQPLSPRTRDPCVVDALLSLSDADSDSSIHDSRTASPQKCAAWVQKGFPIAQLSANGGCPTSLHPAALFYLRNLREQEEAEERAAAKRAKEKAERREAKKLEKVVTKEGIKPNCPTYNSNNPNPNSSSFPSSGQPPSRTAVGERLRGKSIQEIESALMERLRSYVSGLGGVLPDGWKVKAAIRQQGANAGGVDAYYFDPTGIRYKSMIKVAQSLGLNCANAAKAKSVAAVLKSSGQQSGKKDSQRTTNRDTPVGLPLGIQGSKSELKLPKEIAVRQDKNIIGVHTANAVDMPPLTAAEISGSIKDEKVNEGYEWKDAPATGAPRKRPRKSGASSSKTANPANVSNTCMTKDTGAGAGTGTTGGKHHGGNGTSLNNGGDGDDDDDDDNRKRQKIKSCPDAQNVKPSKPKKIEERPSESQEKERNPDKQDDRKANVMRDGKMSKMQNKDEIAKETTSNRAEQMQEPKQKQKQSQAKQTDRTPDPNDDNDNRKRQKIQSCPDAQNVKQSKPKKMDKRPSGSQEKERNPDKQDDMKAKVMGDGKMSKMKNKDEFAKETTSNRAEQMQEPKQKPKPKQKQSQAKQADRKPVEKTVYTQALSRFQGQLKRLRQEQALVEAYAADGWRGASREKVKPVAEIRRAKEQINRCIEVIRDCVRVCDEAEGDKKIPADMYDENGELELDDIFCAKCLANHSTDDNDIILCDGDCDRAYHVKCLVPSPDISLFSEDEGWLCPACDTKIDLIDSINEEFGTEYEYNMPWDQILVSDTLPTSPRLASEQGLVNPQTIDLGRLEGLLEGADLPSEDEDDEDYKASSSGSESGSLSKGNRQRNDGEEEKSEDSVSLISEDPGTALAGVDEDDMKAFAERYARVKDLDDVNGDESGGHSANLIVNGKRHRSKVDYVALSKEMFGNLSSPMLKEEEEEEEDGDWIPRNSDAGNSNNNREG